MSNTVQFQNAYVEVLLDNFLSVVKQNVFLQAQQKVSEELVEKSNSISTQANDLAEKNVSLQAEIMSLENRLQSLGDIDEKLSTGERYKQEKDRVQNSLNDFMRKNKILQDELNDSKMSSQKTMQEMSDNITHLNKYVARLEEQLPASKLKKIRLGGAVSEELQTTESTIKNGGSF